MSLVNVNTDALRRIENQVQVADSQSTVPEEVFKTDAAWQSLVKLMSEFAINVEANDLVTRLDDPFSDEFFHKKARDIVRDFVRLAEKRFGAGAPLEINDEEWCDRICGCHHGHHAGGPFIKIYPGGAGSLSSAQRLVQNIDPSYSWVTAWNELEAQYGGTKGKDAAAGQIADQIVDDFLGWRWSSLYQSGKKLEGLSLSERFDAVWTERKDWIEVKLDYDVAKRLRNGIEPTWQAVEKIHRIFGTIQGYINNVESETGLEGDIEAATAFIHDVFQSTPHGRAMLEGDEKFKGTNLSIDVRPHGIHLKFDKGVIDELKQYLWNWAPHIATSIKQWQENGKRVYPA